jgi:hypothetical protein
LKVTTTAVMRRWSSVYEATRREAQAMTAAVLPLTHPVHTALASVGAAVAQVAGYNPVYLSPDDKATALLALTRLESQITALRGQILAEAGDLADRDGHRDPGAWLSAHALIDPAKAHALWKQALQVHHTPDREPLATAMTAGAVSTDHARVITHTLDQLQQADEVDSDTLQAAQTQLITDASQFRPAELRRLGRHVLDIIAPQVAETVEARRVLAQERQAATRTSLTITPLGDGTTRLHGTLPDAIGTRLRTTLEAYAQPRIAALSADGRTLPRAHVLGEALGQMLETLDPHRLPLHGGDATTVIITIPLDHLRAELGTATLEGSPTGDHSTGALSAGEARRLACTATILPAVLDGDSQPLDLGRTRRLFTPAQRKALKLRDGGCRAEDCTVPATWCDAHHTNPWSHGGPTNLDNALLLCGHHHRRAHDPHYDHTRLPDGTIRFHRRT